MSLSYWCEFTTRLFLFCTFSFSLSLKDHSYPWKIGNIDFSYTEVTNKRILLLIYSV